MLFIGKINKTNKQMIKTVIVHLLWPFLLQYLSFQAVSHCLYHI